MHTFLLSCARRSARITSSLHARYPLFLRACGVLRRQLALFAPLPPVGPTRRHYRPRTHRVPQPSFGTAGASWRRRRGHFACFSHARPLAVHVTLFTLTHARAGHTAHAHSCARYADSLLAAFVAAALLFVRAPFTHLPSLHFVLRSRISSSIPFTQYDMHISCAPRRFALLVSVNLRLRVRCMCTSFERRLRMLPCTPPFVTISGPSLVLLRTCRGPGSYPAAVSRFIRQSNVAQYKYREILAGAENRTV
jgi:hypothetical protein